MSQPNTGIPAALPQVDHIAEHRPALAPLVIGIVSGEEGRAAAFVEHYRGRLFDLDGLPIVPSAHAGRLQLAAAKDASRPDVALLDELAGQLRSNVPPGAGKGWRTKRFALCLDVVDVMRDVTATTVEGRRTALLDGLYERWEKRHPALDWARALSDGTSLPGKVLGVVLTALLNGPSRWLLGRRLNGRGWRWLGGHVTETTGLHGDFLDLAQQLSPSVTEPWLAGLQRRVLFDALLRDVDALVRRHRFLPHRRRRRWTPVLLLDATTPLARELVELYAQLTQDRAVMPLLVLAALPDEAAAVDADSAGPTLRALVQKQTRARRVVLRLPDGETFPPHVRRATPKLPGRVSAFAPLTLTVLLLLAISGYGGYRYFGDACSNTKINALGERVGIIAEGCSFEQPDAEGVPRLSELEAQVFANNRFVDGLKDVDGEPRYYREVVFFAPLTRPKAIESTAPPNAIWQLRGAVDFQRQYNSDADADRHLVPIKLVLANSGDRFTDGDWVAARIAERPHGGSGELAAVIGISQSRPDALTAIRDHLAGIPVIGSSMYGAKLTEDHLVFLAAPLNQSFASAIAGWFRQNPSASAPAVVYDPADEYFSRELHDELAELEIGSPETDIALPEKGENLDLNTQLQAMCDSGRTPVLTNRADQVITFLDRVKYIPACTSRGQLQIVVGPGGIVEAAAGHLAGKYPWAKLTMTSLGQNPVAHEETTGRDSFHFAAVAIAQAYQDAKAVWEPALVRTQLTRPGLFQPFGLPPIDDREGTSRIRLITIA